MILKCNQKNIGLQHNFFSFYVNYNEKIDLNNIKNLSNLSIAKLNLCFFDNFQYIADPFIYKHNNKIFIFAETLKNGSLGKILCIELDNQYNLIKNPKIVLDEKFHLSYPFLIKDEGNLYMLPEQSNNKKGLVLYICKNFPYIWEEHIVLLKNPQADSTLFKYKNIFWLFTYDLKRLKFCLYYSDKLVTNKWILHRNEFYEDNKGNHLIGTGRGAGNIFLINNKIYRPVQINNNKYGEGLEIREILEINKDTFLEKSIFKLENTNIHHISFLDNILVFDYNTLKNNPKFSNKLDLEIIKFWNLFEDRKEMIKIYKNIGKNSNNKKILDIGYQFYNKYNKFFFNNDNILYYQTDIINNHKLQINYKHLSCDKFFKIDFLNFVKKYPNYKNYFNCIISYGVLGVGFLNSGNTILFNKNEVRTYIFNCYFLLSKNGLFYFMTHEHELDKYNIDINYLQFYFKIIEKKKITEKNGSIRYFFTCQKNNITIKNNIDISIIGGGPNGLICSNQLNLNFKELNICSFEKKQICNNLLNYPNLLWHSKMNELKFNCDYNKYIKDEEIYKTKDIVKYYKEYYKEKKINYICNHELIDILKLNNYEYCLKFKNDKNYFYYKSKFVILCTGIYENKNKLKINSNYKFCKYNFDIELKNKKLVLVGSGNSSVDYIIHLLPFNKIYWIIRGSNELNIYKTHKIKLKNIIEKYKDNLTCYHNTEIKKIYKDNKILLSNNIVIENIDFCNILIGFHSKSSLNEKIGLIFDNNTLILNENYENNLKNIYAFGSLMNKFNKEKNKKEEIFIHNGNLNKFNKIIKNIKNNI